MNNQATGTVYATYEMTDFSKMDRKGKRVLKPIKDDPYKETNISFRCFKGKSLTDKDAEGKPKEVWFGMVIGTNTADNTPKFRLLTIRNQRIFNLENEKDAKEWHVIRHWEEVKGSPNQNSKPRFEIYDEEVVAQNDYDTAINVGRAMQLIEGISKDEQKLRNFSRVFGIDGQINSPTVLRGLLAKLAMKFPQRIIKAVENTTHTEILEIFHKGKQLGLITYDINKGFTFKNGIPLGSSEEAAIVTMARDEKLFSHMSIEANREEGKHMTQRGGNAPQDPAFDAAKLNAELNDRNAPAEIADPSVSGPNTRRIEREHAPLREGVDF